MDTLLKTVELGSVMVGDRLEVFEVMDGAREDGEVTSVTEPRMGAVQVFSGDAFVISGVHAKFVRVS